MIKEYMDMLKYKRPSWGKFEELFIDEFITPLGVMEDNKGNLFKHVLYPNGDSPDIAFSCHTDTVHNDDGYQVIKVKGQYLELHDIKDSNCLGADDCSGVWLMMEMIRAGKPGLYLFHRGEEAGGVGSSYIANTTPELLNGIKCVIALDRKGTRDVITHQGSRCCSDAFGESLAKALNGKFTLSDRGTFTDSANYTGVVGECTNLSVGYEAQHSFMETQDFKFLTNLRLKLISLDYSELVFERQPGDVDPNDWSWDRKASHRDVHYYKDIDRNPWAGFTGDYADRTPKRYDLNYDDTKWDDLDGLNSESKDEPDDSMDMNEMVKDYPDVVCRMLSECGVTEADLSDEIYLRTGDLV